MTEPLVTVDAWTEQQFSIPCDHAAGCLNAAAFAFRWADPRCGVQVRLFCRDHTASKTLALARGRKSIHRADPGACGEICDLIAVTPL